MNFIDTVKARIKFVEKSKVEVTYSSAFSWVSIQGENVDFFMQGDEADEFIDKAKSLYDSVDISLDEAAMSCAYDYL